MDEYRRYLVEQLNRAVEEFEEAKASAIKDLEGMDAFHAQNWGAAYFTKIDKITSAGTKVMHLQNLLKAYDYCNSQEEM